MSPDPDDRVDALTAYLGAQVERLLAGEEALPGAPDAVHHTRVAARRLRSTLRVYGDLLDLEPVDAAAIDEELRWYAGVLGDLRDLQVQRARFAAALEQLPAEQLVGPVAEGIDDALAAEQAAARRRVADTLEGGRYLLLRATLEGWLRGPPASVGSPGPLRKRARKAARRADRRLAEACGPDGTDEALHRARKAAKRARYAGELLRPLGHGRKQAKRYKLRQTLLGDHQDSVVAAATLRRLADGVAPGGTGFTLGLLYDREAAERQRLRDAVCGRADT